MRGDRPLYGRASLSMDGLGGGGNDNERNNMRNEQQDLKILADAFFAGLTILEWEYGGIGIDPKRPFGNSDVEADMLEMLEWEPEGDDGDGPCYSSKQRYYVDGLYRKKLIPYLREQWAKLTPNV